jgi:hypothetical protein
MLASTSFALVFAKSGSNFYWRLQALLTFARLE